MKRLKLIAVDLDGPLLIDTFAPLLRLSCEFYGIAYSRDMESNMLSRNRKQAIDYMRAQVAGLPTYASMEGKSDAELNDSFFAFRAEYLKKNPMRLADGAEEFLRRLPEFGLQMVCYGGLDENYMRSSMGAHADIFAQYVCTNEFRPGMAEIVALHGLQPEEVVFIDDVNFAAIHAREIGAAFIGVPSQAEWSWQRQEMSELGVKFMVDDVSSIGAGMLAELDSLAQSGGLWE